MPFDAHPENTALAVEIQVPAGRLVIFTAGAGQDTVTLAPVYQVSLVIVPPGSSDTLT